MAIDESFKKPGSIPFKWEIKPGVPKQQAKHPHQQPPCPSPPRKLRPPPSADPRSASFASAPRARSDRWRLDRQSDVAAATATAVSVGCFAASPLLKRKPSVKKKDGGYASGHETPRRWSVSSRNSAVSPFRESPPSSFGSSSGRSTPSFRVVRDAEWAGFGLF